MNDLIQLLSTVKEIQTLLTACVCITVFDTATGIMKHIRKGDFQSRKLKEGFLNKMVWYVAILFGSCMYYILKNSVLLYTITFTCILTELSSLWENFKDMGVMINEKRRENNDESK